MGHVACSNSARELPKLTLSLCICTFIYVGLAFSYSARICVVLVFNLCASCQNILISVSVWRWKTTHAACSLDSAGQRRSNQGWSLAVVKAARAGCLCEANIILLGVLLVSGTSFSAHLLLLCLFFTLTTPRPLLLILSLYFLFVRRRSASTPRFSLWTLNPSIRQRVLMIRKLLVSNSTTIRFTAPSRALCWRKAVLSTSSRDATSRDLSLQQWTVLYQK